MLRKDIGIHDTFPRANLVVEQVSAVRQWPGEAGGSTFAGHASTDSPCHPGHFDDLVTLERFRVV